MVRPSVFGLAEQDVSDHGTTNTIIVKIMVATSTFAGEKQCFSNSRLTHKDSPLRLNHPIKGFFTMLKNSSLLLFSIALAGCVSTQPPTAGQRDFVTANQTAQFVANAQLQFGLNPAMVEASLAQAVYQPKIISLMNRKFEAQPWAVYQAHMMTANRISQGKAFASANKVILTQAQSTYGVPADIVVAIIGVETMYGTNQGNYRVLDSLATLSFGYPKRAAFFQSELANYLVLCQKNHWDVGQLKGSYAGAFGIGQFMPSSYRQYAVSATEQSPDISSKPSDAILSVAHYFAGHGWIKGQPIAISVHWPASKSVPTLPKMTQPKHDLRYWQAVGVALPANLSDLSMKAELVVETGSAGQQQAWLIFHNFYVIARYNPSLNYSLAVFCLSDQL